MKAQKPAVASPTLGTKICYQKICLGGPAACHSKANKQAKLVERKVCFISDASNWGEAGGHPSKGQLPASNKQGVRAFVDRVGGVTCRNSTVIFKLVISGLPSIILVVSGQLVNLQFRGTLVPISLQSILGIVEVQVLGTV